MCSQRTPFLTYNVPQLDGSAGEYRDQVLAVIPAYHPVWAAADPADIAYADVRAGHGNFRAWAKITAHVVTALARLDRDRPDREILQWVFSRLGGSGG